MAFINENNKRYLYLLLTFAIIMVFLTVFSDRGLIRIYQLSKERDNIRTNNRLLKTANENLREEMQRLKTDNRYIEEIARKELGMVKPTDVIYQFEK
ncbi:MAG: septum formation initiator family protein [Deltaproteobacteria bacterium]|nr:septum formation initiator family protein [Deltaproteobacteria bacterium]